ncbi:MAG: cytochrome P450, partial [Microlunatus sp.]|nr:cytochrome P450 [Microlunatus sp.]
MSSLVKEPETETFPYERRCPFSMPGGYEHREPKQVPLGPGGETWLATRYADVREALFHPALSNDRTDPGYPSPIPIPDEMKAGGSMLALDPPEHTAIRSLVQAEFTRHAVSRLEPMIESAVKDAVDDLLAGGPTADLHSGVGIRVTMTVITTMLGMTLEDQAFLHKRTLIMFGHSATAEERRQAVVDLDDYFEEIVLRKLADPQDDLITRMAQRWPAPKDTRALAQLTRLLLNGGHDSTASMVSIGILTLLQHPDQLALLRSRPELVDSAVEELLRFATVADLTTPRVAKQDAVIGGVAVGAGQGVFPSTAAANRDPEVFADPDRLDITRADNPHLVFGYG